MFIPNSHLVYCIGKADEIADIYEVTYLGADDRLRYIDHLHDLCEKYLNCKIRVIQLNDIGQDDSAVLASCIKTPGGFDIVLVRGLNYCWGRFATCKELFHALLDKEEYRNMNIVGHIEEATATFPVAEARAGSPVIAEMLAEVAAMEFMFPYKRRQQALKGPSKDDFLEIAEAYKVPRVHVEKYLSPGYMEGLKPFSRHE